jgi:hypothetical protein
MKAWEYHFDPVSKTDWIKQIEKDLKQKPFSSLQGEWWPGEELFPVVHQDDMSGGPVRLPDSFFSQPPFITEYINASGFSATNINQKILHALKQDTQSMILRLHLSQDIAFKKIFKDVIRDIISISIEPGNPGPKELARFFNMGEEDIYVRLLRNENAPALTQILDTFSTSQQYLDKLRLVYYFPSTGNWSQQTAMMLKYILNDLALWNSSGRQSESFFRQAIIVLQADHLYFKHIIQTRVLHLLWQNLKRLYAPGTSKPQRTYLECHIEQNKNEQPDHFLIRASMSALAASLSGTHSLCIHQSGRPDSAVFYQRIIRNIHHLLQLESNMAKGVDPLSGSYPIDLHSVRITQKIWDRIF